MIKAQHRDLLTKAVDSENRKEAGGEIKSISTDEKRNKDISKQLQDSSE